MSHESQHKWGKLDDDLARQPTGPTDRGLFLVPIRGGGVQIASMARVYIETTIASFYHEERKSWMLPSLIA